MEPETVPLDRLDMESNVPGGSPAAMQDREADTPTTHITGPACALVAVPCDDGADAVRLLDQAGRADLCVGWEMPPADGRGGGDVLADLGVPDPDVAVAKAEIVGRLKRLIDRQTMTRADAARRLGIDRRKFSDLLRGRLGDCPIGRLVRFLNDMEKTPGRAARRKARPTAPEGTTVLDGFMVEFRVSSGCTPELLRDTLRRLDESPFWKRLPARLQATLNSARMDDILVVIRR